MFTWEDKSGLHLTPAEMTSTHIFYSLRMIWNHTAPPQYRFYPYCRYTDVPDWTIEFKRTAAIHFIRELKNRTDLPANMAEELNKMAHVLTEVFPNASLE